MAWNNDGNLIFSIGSLIVLHSLLNKFSLELWLKAAIQYASVIILLSYCHFELAADVLLVFLLLTYFNLIKEEDFFSSIPKNLLAGTIGATLYLAKSYGFPFFIFHFLVIHLFLNPNKRNAVKHARHLLFFSKPALFVGHHLIMCILSHRLQRYQIIALLRGNVEA